MRPNHALQPTPFRRANRADFVWYNGGERIPGLSRGAAECSRWAAAIISLLIAGQILVLQFVAVVDDRVLIQSSTGQSCQLLPVRYATFLVRSVGS